jgi:P27 family predicted phage terminase small subunit
MGIRGPKPEPAAVKEAKGNPGRRPIGADPEPDTPEGGKTNQVDAPIWLKGEGLAIWDRLAPRLVERKLLTAIDAEAFGRYCRTFARWIRMQDVLDNEGETYESESAHGKLKRAHPAFLIADRAERQLLSAEDRFGLNPAERQRLFAARASQPFTGDLFGALPAGQTPKSGKRQAEARAAGGASPVGFLN